MHLVGVYLTSISLFSDHRNVQSNNEHLNGFIFKDRIVATEWLRKLEHPAGSGDEDNNHGEKTDTDAESISTPKWPVRNHCMRLLLIMLQNRQLIGVFRHMPDRETDLLDLTSIYANDIDTMLAANDVAASRNYDGDDVAANGASFRFAGGRQPPPPQNAALSLMALAPGHQRVWQSPEQRAAIVSDAYRPFMLGEWQQLDRQWRAPLRVPRTVYSEITIDEGTSELERQPLAAGLYVSISCVSMCVSSVCFIRFFFVKLQMQPREPSRATFSWHGQARFTSITQLSTNGD